MSTTGIESDGGGYHIDDVTCSPVGVAVLAPVVFPHLLEGRKTYWALRKESNTTSVAPENVAQAHHVARIRTRNA